ncbi:leukocyte surface antigen CD47-like [Arvicanthis niloticus]|uniref:leukocyte surface antigen CD47-like n=1 Tax=Arvicanthis niloticus TaxID=61156 RepID=UPI0014875DE3|nr:leukocyte surface antigen CD47-like [Arvicanthis niloticus]
MWPVVAALLLGSFHCCLAQLTFKNISSVNVGCCSRDVLIPCYVTNMQAENINELFLKWKFEQSVIFIFDGPANKSTTSLQFPSAQISPSEFLKGNASLKLARNDTKKGNYTCEVTELSREGKHTVELITNDGLAQLTFKNISSVKVNHCFREVLIPCYVTNIEAENINQLYLEWTYGLSVIIVFDGPANKSTTSLQFPSAQIFPSEFLKGNASLKLARNDTRKGTYTCKVKELGRKGQQVVKVKKSEDSLCSFREEVAIMVFPFLTILLFWVQFGILLRKYKFNWTNTKIVFLCTFGLLFTFDALFGVIFFLSGVKDSKIKSYGLFCLISPSVMPAVLQYVKFKPGWLQKASAKKATLQCQMFFIWPQEQTPQRANLSPVQLASHASPSEVATLSAANTSLHVIFNQHLSDSATNTTLEKK